MNGQNPNSGPSRRGFLKLLSATGITALLPGSATLVRAAPPQIATTVGGPIDPFAAAAASNANYRRLSSILGAVIKTPAGTGFSWMEQYADGSLHHMRFDPETPLEWEEANELFEVNNWRSWRTVAELEQQMAEPGPWMIRLNLFRHRFFCYVPGRVARGLLAGAPFEPEQWRHDGDYLTNDASAAGRFSSREVLKLVPLLTAAYSEDEQEMALFEAVRPEHADKDLRLLRLRPSGFGPQVYKEYDLATLSELFRSDTQLVNATTRPFIKGSDGFFGLIDFEGGMGTAWFERPDQFCLRVPSSSLPVEMLQPTGTVLAHLFARSKNQGPYQYLGLGHLHKSAANGVARFHLVPELRESVYESLGGYAGWELRVSETTLESAPVKRLKDDDSIEEAIELVFETTSAHVSLSRWSEGEMVARFEERMARVKYRPFQGSDRRWRYWVLPGMNEDDEGEPSAGTSPILPDPTRAAVACFQAYEAIDRFFREQQLPESDEWVVDPNDPLPPEVIAELKETEENANAMVLSLNRLTDRSPKSRVIRGRIEAGHPPVVEPVALLAHDSPIIGLTTTRNGALVTTDGHRECFWLMSNRIAGDTTVFKNPVKALAASDARVHPLRATAIGRKIYLSCPKPGWKQKSVVPFFVETATVSRLLVSPDEQRFMAQSDQGHVQVWDIENLNTVADFTAPGRIIAIGFGAQLPLVAYIEDPDRLMVREVASDEIWLEGTVNSHISCAEFLASGRKLAVAGDMVDIWDVENGAIQFSVVGADGPITKMAVDATGTSMVVMADHSPAIYVDLTRGKPMATLDGKNQRLNLLHFSTDGDYLLATTNEGVWMWERAAINRYSGV